MTVTWAFGLWAGAAAADTSAERVPAISAPLELAIAIERRADRSSFADLERFGAAASHGSDRESLSRLQHVAWVLLNQSEFERFDAWNTILLRNAERQGDRRYIAIARINALKSRYDRGDPSVQQEISRLAQTETDWFVRVNAANAEAMMLVDHDQTGLALKRLSAAEDLIPADDPAANAAESTVWETIGLALMVLDDLDGSAKAFQRADFQFADPAYPRPDFDGIYNMAHMAVILGDSALARRLSSVHHRLAARSDLPHLKIWDQNLCAMVADRFGEAAEVMGCLRGLDIKLTGAEFLGHDILPLRAIAEARLGQVARAQADLDAIRAHIAAGDMSASGLEREPQVQAEILLAQGQARQAFAALSAYERDHSGVTTRRFNAGMRQITDTLETQLDTARRDAQLQRQAKRERNGIIALAGMLVVCAAGVLLWQRRIGVRLRAAQLKAETASRAKSEFLANMSHEIRTPLNGVVGVADMLAASDLPQREREMVAIIRDSGRSLERLLSDVLDLARVEAGRLSIEPAPFHAGDLVRSVAGLARAKAETKGLRLDAQVAPELEGWFLGDAMRIGQILTNLVSNAVKFTDAGSVTVTAESPGPGRLRFKVLDTGVGFDDAEKERLFGRFQQADGSITRRFGGSGLGLAISRQLAALMGGALDCHSQPGLGSCFYFEAHLPPTAAPNSQEDGVHRSEAEDSRPVRVLVADDHEINLQVVRMMLDQFGVETTTAANGREAVEALARDHFDAVLMDMQMPVMDGLEATRRIRQDERAHGRPRTPVIMLSANAMPEHRQASHDAGADEHISKPLTITALMDALNAALVGHNDAPRDLAQALAS